MTRGSHTIAYSQPYLQSLGSLTLLYPTNNIEYVKRVILRPPSQLKVGYYLTSVNNYKLLLMSDTNCSNLHEVLSLVKAVSQ